MPVCMQCGRTLGTEFIRMFNDEDLWYLRKWRCRICDSKKKESEDDTKAIKKETIAQVAVPAVMRYLISELSACNISVRFNISKIKDDGIMR